MPRHEQYNTEHIRSQNKDAHLIPIAAKEAQHDVELSQTLLGRNHPFTRDVANERDTIAQSIAVTATLFDETIARWSNIIGVTPKQRDAALKNLITFDFKRLGHLTYLTDIVGILNTQESTDGKIAIPYTLADTAETKTFPFTNGFITYDLGGRRTYEGYQDPNVPFVYLLAGDVETYREHLPDTYNHLQTLYKGTPIPVGEHGGKPPIVLSPETRKELDNIGCLVLHPTADRFATDILTHADEKGAIRVPIALPWAVNGNMSKHFTHFIAGQIEHETMHTRDFRIYDGARNSIGLFEIRAIGTQYDFHKRYEQESAMRGDIQSLDPYLQSLTGKTKDMTHMETYYLQEITKGLATLPKPEAKYIKKSLAKFGYTVPV